jgi:hypothetical protein
MPKKSSSAKLNKKTKKTAATNETKTKTMGEYDSRCKLL